MRRTLDLVIVGGQVAGPTDAIGEHGQRLAQALRERGCRADVAAATGPDLVAGVAAYDAVLVQYNPFNYARWGFAPWLPAALARLRRRRPRPAIALMIHEPYVPMIGWRWRLMGAWQRAQLLALRTASDIVLASIEAWTELFRRRPPRRPTFHLPVGATVPDRRDARAERRARLRADAETIVLASLTTGHPSRLLESVAAAANAVAERRRRTVFVNLGAGAPAPAGLRADVEVVAPGFLPADELAAELAAADIYLAPFVDGVSTRRTSMMAALQHGLAVVGTDGALTDRLLRDAHDALRLVPVERVDLFANAVGALTERPDERQALGQRARLLYEQRFDWPVLAERLLEILARRRTR